MSYRERSAKYKPRESKTQREMDILNSRRRTSVYWRQKLPVQKIDGKYTIMDMGGTKLGADTFGPTKKSSDASASTSEEDEDDAVTKSMMADAPGQNNIFVKPKTPEAANRTIGEEKKKKKKKKKTVAGVDDAEDEKKLKDKVSRKVAQQGSSFSTFIKTALDHRVTNIVILFSTIIALFGVDFVVVFLPKDPHDAVMGWISLVIFITFLAELVAASVYKKNYFLSFFFALDVVGTLSLIPDIPIFMNAIGLDRSGLQLAKAGRVVRSGTRTTRLLRMLRLVRMVRIVRLFKLNKFFKRLLNNKNAFEESEKEEEERKGRSRGERGEGMKVEEKQKSKKDKRREEERREEKRRGEERRGDERRIDNNLSSHPPTPHPPTHPSQPQPQFPARLAWNSPIWSVAA